MAEAIDSLYGEDYFHYLRERSAVRRWVRKIYLNDIRRLCRGKTIDFGCGIGELLRILPPGSIGFEVNPVAVDYCRRNGLEVSAYDPETDQYRFAAIPEGVYTSFTMNHVLEHIPDSYLAIGKIFESCYRLGIERIVFTVPGYKGFASDKTHRTFIDKEYLKNSDLLNNDYYKLVLDKYFPFNSAGVGRYFRHNELRLVFDRR